MTSPIVTPWGPADSLRERRLRPGPGIPREDVERSQRERLYGAMVAVVDEVGYEGMRVGKVAERAGVSRSALYEYFADRDECFFATFDALIAEVLVRIADAYDEQQPWDQRLRRILERLVEMIVEQPAAARLCLLELYCAGPRAEERRNRSAAVLERVALEALDQSPERAGMPPALIRALVGGVRTVFQRHLRGGDEHELPGLVDDLWQWALSYPTPPVPLKPPPIEPPDIPQWTPTTQFERLCAALVQVICEKGYQETKVADVASAASTSLSTFYTHFPSKRKAFLATCDAGAAFGFNAAYEAYQRHDGEWGPRTHAAMREFLKFLSAEPRWTYIASVEQFGAGAQAQARRDRSMDMFTAQLAPGFELRPELPEVTRHAIGGALYTLTYSHILNHGAERLLEILPYASYVTLTPFLGAEEAAAIANDSDVGLLAAT